MLFLTNSAFALEQHEKLWLGVNRQFVLTQDKKWLAFLFTQFRFINRDYPVQVYLVEGGIGAQLRSDISAWMGYRWSGHNPNNGFFQENRLFQQIIWVKNFDNIHVFVSRTRFEETDRQDQLSVRLRQRLALEIKKSFIFDNVYPFFYEEPFFQLKNAIYTTNKLFSENRLFIGVNIYASKKTWWEVGYINQYIMHSALQSQNQMDHVASITYNL